MYFMSLRQFMISSGKYFPFPKRPKPKRQALE